MSNFLGVGSSAVKRRTPTPAAALRIQNSANGVARPFGYGQARIAGNLLNYFGFTSIAVQNSSSSGGGKGGGGSGGGKGGSATTGYDYYTSAAFGLCEGPIDSIVQAWENKSATALSGPNAAAWSIFTGGYAQEPWDYLSSQSPGQAQSYRGIAYAGLDNFLLGTSPELPNFTFDVRFGIADALVETSTVPSSSPYTVSAAYFSWDYGVVSYLTVPLASPYQIALPAGSTATVGSIPSPAAVSGLAAAIETDDSTWFTSASAGVVWDSGAENGTPGEPLAKVSGTPATGQYAFPGNGTIEFAAADAGQPVVFIGAALSPGVYYTSQATANVTAGSAVLTALPTPGIAVGARVVNGAGLAPGAFVVSVSGGSATGTASAGSNILSNVTGSFSASSGTPISDAAGAIPAGTTVSSVTAASVSLSAAAAGSAAQVPITVSLLNVAGVLNDDAITLSSSSGIVVGAAVADDDGLLPGGLAVAGVSGTTVTLSFGTGLSLSEAFNFTTEIVADVNASESSLGNPSSVAPLATGAYVEDAFGYLPPGTSVVSATPGSITMSANAAASVAADALSFASALILSQPATASGTGVAVTFRGAMLTQVLVSPAQGQYTLSAQAGSFGTYTFSSADAGAAIEIVDLPDANPADVIEDFLTNPYYGMTQFDPARIGDLSVYRDYCLAAGLLVSPTISSQAQANQFLQDLMKATNSELVWSGGKLTAVPYGDQALSANGAAYAPPAQPVYELDDDDFLDNQGTNPKSVSESASPDPVTVTRTDIADQENDIKLEYLDRANLYNPTIVEAQDNAAIETFGLKNSGSKQMHLFCNATAALNSAQLMLGRQSVLRSFSFTLDRKYILLDPMDVVAITDANAGLQDQWVRIREITENDDRSLSITAEEYLEGTASAPQYGHQKPAPYVPNYTIAAPNALAPMFLDAPVQIGNVLGMETILCTNGPGPNWGGCDIYVASDNVNFRYAGMLLGGTVMGSLTASFPVGSDPDTTDTLGIDLSASKGSLTGGTSADADAGNTLCLVDSELVTYETAALIAQFKYNLGTYLRRGFYGTAIAAHSAGAPFARLRPGSYFTMRYGSGDVGKTVYVKLLSFNPWGSGRQTLDQVSSYSHTLTAPPAPPAGLLSGLIQSPDIGLGQVQTGNLASGAATNQVTASHADHVALPVSPSTATLVSASLTTIGGTVQIAYNTQFINQSSTGAETAAWQLLYGSTVLDSGSITVQPSSAATIAKQTSFTSPVGSGTFSLIAQGQTSTDGYLLAVLSDLSATEIRR